MISKSPSSRPSHFGGRTAPQRLAAARMFLYRRCMRVAKSKGALASAKTQIRAAGMQMYVCHVNNPNVNAARAANFVQEVWRRKRIPGDRRAIGGGGRPPDEAGCYIESINTQFIWIQLCVVEFDVVWWGCGHRDVLKRWSLTFRTMVAGVLLTEWL